MRSEKLTDMVRGWFVGDFVPTVYKTQQVEVGMKRYHAGEKEERHFHKIATEITVVVSGEILMNGKKFSAGDIVVIDPGEKCRFEALTDAVNVVVKLPGAPNDKYLAEDERC